MELDGARVLVCGGGRRLGRAIAEDLAAAGCSVAVSSRSNVDPVIVHDGRTALALQADLSDAAQARAVVTDAAAVLAAAAAAGVPAAAIGIAQGEGLTLPGIDPICLTEAREANERFFPAWMN